ncbi:hypothetical protein PVK06_020817 [Gossypium arboreum]|uniref:RNase H type-1 domain-containing protein n=1 Tax=Gossypium arboreum TaxID=29729 RepID=A0ABR0PNC8_GOSAR|nr:hypothetical protein PVK06_020817 [Gossypium arboreum]
MRNDVKEESDWSSPFGILCWKIWKYRCLCVFQNVSFNIDHILISSWSWAKALKTSSGKLAGNTDGHKRCCKWIPPPSSSIELNTDGARNPSSNLATSTTMAKDEFGNWIRGIGRNISSCSVEHAEHWAINDGLTMAWDAQ